MDTNIGTIAYTFMFNFYHYVYNFKTRNFHSLYYYDLKLPKNIIHNELIIGLSYDECKYNRILFGECNLNNIHIRSLKSILFEEFSNPFLLFQLFAIVFWYYNTYKLYAGLILIMILLLLCFNLTEKHLQLKHISHFIQSNYTTTTTTTTNVNVYRRNTITNESAFTTINSVELVPGDIIEIPDKGSNVPCDCMLLTGSVIVNEVILTGVNKPVHKAHLPQVDQVFNVDNDMKYILHAGSTVIAKYALGNAKVIGVVCGNYWSTIKGSVIRRLMCVKERKFLVMKDAVKFMLIVLLNVIVGCGVVFYLLVRSGKEFKYISVKCVDLVTMVVPPFLPICLNIGLLIVVNKVKRKGIVCLDKSKLLLAGKVNVVVFNQNEMLMSEKDVNVVGFVPVKITNDNNYNGSKGNCNIQRTSVLFDKCEVKIDGNDNSEQNSIKKLFVECLACCNNITKVNDTLIGDPIDIKLFESIEWKFNNNNNDNSYNYDDLILSYVHPKNEIHLQYKINNIYNEHSHSHINDNNIDTMISNIIETHYELGIVRRFESSQITSTISKNINETSYKLFCKGSPEVIRELCNQNTIPLDYNEQLNHYISKGYYVICLAYKLLNLNYFQIQTLPRSTAENNLSFLGFVIIHHNLKDKTTSTIEQLTEANIKLILSTGDDILTAISISKQCKLIPQNEPICTCEFINNNLKWKTISSFKDEDYYDESISDVDIRSSNNDLMLVETSINQMMNCQHILQDSISDDYYQLSMNYNNNNNKICKDIIDTDNINIDIHELTSSIYDDEHLTLAIHGNTFEKLYHLNQQYLNTKSIIVHNNNNNKYTKYHHIFKYIIHYCSIYANMSPEHKAMLIQSLQHEHQTVLMCGNNINDYNALKCADVSYTFHSNEHISCVSSFQSLTPNISALPTLLKESKACLVTTIQMLKYIIIFSLIQSISTILLHSQNSYQTTLQFLTSDLFIICPLSLLLPYTQTYPSLTKYQPSSNFISFPIIISICLNSICVLICQIGFIYLKRFMFIIENAYDINLDKCNINIKGGIVPCYVNTGLFFISTIQYILFAFVFSISKPFRKPIYTNYPLLIYLIGVLVYTALMLFYNNKVTPSEMGLLEIKGNEFKIGIASICVVSIIFGLVVEYVVVPWCIKVYNGSGNGKGKEKGKERMMKEIESDIIQEVKNNI